MAKLMQICRPNNVEKCSNRNARKLIRIMTTKENDNVVIEQFIV